MGRVKKEKVVKLPIRSEHDEQCALFKMIEWYVPQYPGLGFAFAIPNGGHRHVTVAAKLKAEGVKRGVLDIYIPISKNIKASVPLILGGTHEVYGHHVVHGLFIEMKKKGNKPTPEQFAYIEYLTSVGYQCNVCYSADEAMKVILDYLK